MYNFFPIILRYISKEINYASSKKNSQKNNSEENHNQSKSKKDNKEVNKLSVCERHNLTQTGNFTI
jgi:hypothetical protein